MMETSASHKRVVVTGMGVIASLGHNVGDFWANIVAGKCGIEKVSLFDAKDYSCQIGAEVRGWDPAQHMDPKEVRDRKSTRLNSSHLVISYAVFCLKKKKNRG